VVGNKLVQFGTGIRNPVGIAFYPGTDDLYVAVNERDGEGDELVPDYMTRVQQGDFYGWPWAYIGQHEEPSLKGRHPDLVAKTKVPDVLFRSHSAPLGLLFYTGTQFPAQYRGGAFVAHHGSWNAASPRGYKIVYVPFQNGRPKGGYDNFALGFWTTGNAPAGVMGRPVGLAQTKDGSLLVADDVGNAVWRISYSGR
jgi:glucose/arabinose dehydrogenase